MVGLHSMREGERACKIAKFGRRSKGRKGVCFCCICGGCDNHGDYGSIFMCRELFYLVTDMPLF